MDDDFHSNCAWKFQVYTDTQAHTIYHSQYSQINLKYTINFTFFSSSDTWKKKSEAEEGKYMYSGWI